MRKVLWLAALATLAGMTTATAACADAAPVTGTAGINVATPLTATVVPLLPPLQHFDVVEQKSTGDDPFNRLKGVIRHRFASALVDLYPVDGSGFHASVGTRFYKKQYIRRDQEIETNGLLYSPRLPRGAPSVRGFRRATPAATVGYTEMIHSNFMIGVEAGTLLGRAVQRLPDARRLAGFGGRDGTSTRLNPIANVTLAYAF